MVLVRLAGAVLVTILIAACGDKKEPMMPDNPSADPLMMDAGGASPETPAPAPSAK